MRMVTVLVLILTWLAPAGQAATIRVARDGSGDFSVVADAVLAASSGDTISIAPGVYPEVRTFETPGGLFEYITLVGQSELTIVGDDRDTVILGPTTPAPDLETGPGGIVTSVTGNVRVRGVTVRNVAAGVWGNDAWMEVEDCRFTGNRGGVIASISGFVTVRDCEFIGSTDSGILVYSALGGDGALVERCTFVDNLYGIDFQPSNCVLLDSVFQGGVVGTLVSFGGSADIRRCEFRDMDFFGLSIHQGARVSLYDSTFNAGMAVNISFDGHLVGSRNVLEGGTYATVDIIHRSAVDFTGNHILNAGGWSVDGFDDGGPPLKHKDFTGNYWGTTDTAQIDEWIRDRSDDPIINYVVIDYLPLAEQPIPVESTSFGEFKARFEP